MTLPLEQAEEDSFNAPAPRFSMPLEEDELTVRSTEYARRESVRNRLSYGDARDNDRSIDAGEPGNISRITQDNSIVLPPDDDLDELSAHMELANDGYVYACTDDDFES